MSTSWRTDEPHDALWYELVNNRAVFAGAVAYGVHIATFLACAYFLVTDKRKGNWKWLLFIVFMFGCATANICFNIRFNELAWIEDRNYPGGPLAFLNEQQSLPINTGGNTVTIVSISLSQMVLIYRVYAVYQRWYIAIVPAMACLASMVLGGFTIWQAALPNASLVSNHTLNFSIPYFSTAMALNVVLTLLLVARLLHMRYQIRRVIGPEYGKMYSTAAAILLESGLLYGLVSFIFVVLYGIENVAAILFIPLLSQLECITPELIILQVTSGRAWNSNTVSAANMSSIKFGRKDNLDNAQLQTYPISATASTDFDSAAISAMTFKSPSPRPALLQRDESGSLTKIEVV